MKKNRAFSLHSIRIGILLACLLLISFFAGRLFSLPRTQADTISARSLMSKLQKKNPASPAGRFTLINVHTPYEGEIGKTDLFIPYDQIVANSSSLPKDKNAQIIIYCKTGRMSQAALATIKKLGYTNVVMLTGGMDFWQKNGGKLLDLSKLSDDVLPAGGVELPVSWGDLAKNLADTGVINLPEFQKAVKMTADQQALFAGNSQAPIKIDATTSQFVVDVLWGLGLAQKSIVYEQGPMGKEEKANVGNFASTGGWTLAQGSAVNYLNRFDFIPLTAEQQGRVAQIAKNVYRPCCGNSTWFPDCNHGMAALAIIELLVNKNVDDATIYRKVLGFNSFWFPDNYLTVATYFARQGTSWDTVDAKDVLGLSYSSVQGAGEIAKKVGPLPYQPKSAGSCGA